MSFSSIIRAVAGGPKTTRAEGDKPEEDMEDEIVPPEDEDKPEEGAEDNASEDEQPEDSAEDDTPAEEDDAAPSGKAGATFADGVKAGRAQERKRMGAIMGNPAADANPQLAAHLAFATHMSAADAITALKAAGPGAGTLATRMAGANQPRLGGAASQSGPASQPDRIAAASKAMIEAKRAKRAR